MSNPDPGGSKSIPTVPQSVDESAVSLFSDNLTSNVIDKAKGGLAEELVPPTTDASATTNAAPSDSQQMNPKTPKQIVVINNDVIPKSEEVAPAKPVPNETKDSNVNVMLGIQEFPPMSETTMEVKAPENFVNKAAIPLESEVGLPSVKRQSAKSHIVNGQLESEVPKKSDSKVKEILAIQEFPPLSETVMEVKAPPDFAHKISIPMESEIGLPPVERQGAESNILTEENNENVDAKSDDTKVMLGIQEFPIESQTEMEVMAPPDFARKVSIPVESDAELSSVHRQPAESHIEKNPWESPGEHVGTTSADPKSKRKSSSDNLVGVSVMSIHDYARQKAFSDPFPKGSIKESNAQSERSKSLEPAPRGAARRVSFNISIDTTEKPEPLKRSASAPIPNKDRRKSILEKVPQDVRTQVRIQLENIKIQLTVVKQELAKVGEEMKAKENKP